MTNLMIAAIEYNGYEGISKKIFNQAKALSSNGCSILLCFGKEGINKIEFENCVVKHFGVVGKYSKSNSGLGDKNRIKDLLKNGFCIESSTVNCVYIRHMLPCFLLIKLLKHFRLSRIFYEIPTYPYYKEQMHVSKNKLKTFLKLCIETFFWPLIYLRVYRICVIRCRSNAKMFKKMVCILNGYDGEPIAASVYSVNSVEMLGIGTIYPYHGYDKIILSMSKCGCKTSLGIPVRFHIVGESDTIDELKALVDKSHLENCVFFHGKLSGKALDNIYELCNIGVGTLRLSLRDADIDTAIKNIEYLAHGLPVLSSGSVFEMNDKGLVYIQTEEKEIDFDDVYRFMQGFSVRQKDGRLFASKCSWNNIMAQIIDASDK